MIAGYPPSGYNDWAERLLPLGPAPSTFTETTMPPKRTPEQIVAHFWSGVDRSGGDDACWEWQRAINRKGYGWMGRDGTTEGTHRIAWRITRGPIPLGLCVLHKCDNRKCCNPSHLFIGDNAANVLDMVSKGRHSRGAKHAAAVSAVMKVRAHRGDGHHMTMFTTTDVIAIRAAWRTGESCGSIARRYGIKYPSTIISIVRGKTWGHLPGFASPQELALRHQQRKDKT